MTSQNVFCVCFTLVSPSNLLEMVPVSVVEILTEIVSETSPAGMSESLHLPVAVQNF